MENQIQIFSNPEFGTVRTFSINGAPFFVGKDVTNALDYSDSFSALKQHVDDEDKKVINYKQFEEMALNQETGEITVSLFDAEFGGTQRITLINESGLYSLIFSSRLPKAKKFKHWVTFEVLPSIRKYGYYIAPNIENVINKIAQDLATNSNELACLTAQTPVLSLQIKAMMEKILADYKKHPDKNFPVIEDLPGEIWKWFKGYEGVYQGSNKGRARSFFRGKCRLLKPTISPRGYLGICLYIYDEKTKKQRKKTFRLNRLIAETFIPNPENKPEVHHKDNDKTNNAADNLEWVTGEENRQYAHEDGRYLKGEKNPNAKLTEDDVRFIRQHYKSGDPEFGNIALAERFKVSDVTITNIVTFKSWKNIQPSQENLLTADSEAATEINLFDDISDNC